jgi:hypothetical protein
VSDKPHLTLLDLSDRELLLVLRDVANAATGYALAADIADRLDIGEDGRRSSQGRLELTPGGNPVKLQGWKLTDVGFQMATGTLKKGTQKTLDSLDDGAMLMTMRWLSQRVVGSNATVSKLMDREYRHGVGRR